MKALCKGKRYYQNNTIESETPFVIHRVGGSEEFIENYSQKEQKENKMNTIVKVNIIRFKKGAHFGTNGRNHL